MPHWYVVLGGPDHGHNTIAYTATPLYRVYTLDVKDLTDAFVSTSIIGTAQTGVAIIVASASLLRLAFYCTIGAWCTSRRNSRTVTWQRTKENEALSSQSFSEYKCV